jgi:hypothetical protein
MTKAPSASSRAAATEASGVPSGAAVPRMMVESRSRSVAMSSRAQARASDLESAGFGDGKSSLR